ncbi:DNA replication ATP-dependent helicase/nuclease DNA2 [Lingula anatina]|uniref:DNA replication ATP-dependent helicase/nuclease n=1 Tax=Lingula anatina TaxID=7574 RepID=A0A1S3GZW9_LINAN|nr:DNA replication ATP-dependent helicase/nuclease DNA2 [Lingula anatina]|eukprot:XP_013379222.1 DNA replication ATP-dependent helicase/nuclease DNA2 [Lingula anatina]
MEQPQNTVDWKTTVPVDFVQPVLGVSVDRKPPQGSSNRSKPKGVFSSAKSLSPWKKNSSKGSTSGKRRWLSKGQSPDPKRLAGENGKEIDDKKVESVKKDLDFDLTKDNGSQSEQGEVLDISDDFLEEILHELQSQNPSKPKHSITEMTSHGLKVKKKRTQIKMDNDKTQESGDKSGFTSFGNPTSISNKNDEILAEVLGELNSASEISLNKKPVSDSAGDTVMTEEPEITDFLSGSCVDSESCQHSDVSKGIPEIDSFSQEKEKSVSQEMKIETVESQEEMLQSDTDNSFKHQEAPAENDHPGLSVSFGNDSWMCDVDFDNIADEELSRGIKQLTPFKQKGRKKDEVIDSRAPAVQFGRHLVLAVHHERNEVILDVESASGNQRRKCVLSGFWTDTLVQPGDIVNVLGDFDDSGVCHISDNQGLLVINPDVLISGTSVVGTVYCMRKTLLNEKLRGCDTGNMAMLHGSIIHALFQAVVQQRAFSKDKVEAIVKEILQQKKFLIEMYGQDATEAVVRAEIDKYIPPMLAWTEKYMPPPVHSFGARPSTSDLHVTKVMDIEENIWSPRYGVKGKIDLTVQVKINGKQKCEKVMPLELKTGKPSFSIEHQGQVTLYSLMSSDRREDPGGGLLLYLKDGSMKTITADYAKKRGLLQLRNELVHYLSLNTEKVESESGTTYHLPKLPRPINNPRSCSKCPQLLNCAVYQRSIDHHDLPDDHAMTSLIPATLAHLHQSHLEYFSHWCLLQELEAKESYKSLKDIWCKSAEQREKEGNCLSDMVLMDRHDAVLALDNGSFIHTFHKQPSKQSPKISLAGFSKGDSLVVSGQTSGHIALCTASVVQVTQTEITVILDRNLQNTNLNSDAVYRLDKNDSFNSMASNYTNLSKLLSDNPHSLRLRELIIDARKPEFELTLAKGAIEKVKHIFKSLNKPQKTAILKILMCKDYVLMKGYPGTGKTSTIVALVRILHQLGLSILLTSYTHSAVDNILLKLKKLDLEFLRLGRESRIHPEILPYSEGTLTKNIKTVGDLAEFYTAKQIVATTCLGTNHVLFTKRRFDICIIDEASQVLQPTCFGPLSCAAKFVLVGDPKQLPPVVQSTEARELGMDESLFMRLDNTGATYELNLQYRMNSSIMRLSNELVYEGALKCGSQDVAEARLQLSNMEDVRAELSGMMPAWLECALSPQPVLFLDTDNISATESYDAQGLVKNDLEAEIVCQLAKCFLRGGLSPQELGIIAPYRNQVKVLHTRLGGSGEVEVNTVDQYQGRDKSVIILSFVRSNSKDDSSSKGRGGTEILCDWRRLNVAVTRAKHKLLFVGSVSTLKKYQPLQKLIQILNPEEICQITSVPDR